MIKLNGHIIEVTKFPNGESKVVIDPNNSPVKENAIQEVILKYKNDDDLLVLMFVKNYLADKGLEANLIITHMPYARMDREIEGQLFTLKYVTRLINSLNFKQVTVLEPHSYTTPALLDRCTVKNVSVKMLPEVAERVGFNPEKDILFYPDEGAQKRYGIVALHESLKGVTELVGMKQRDLSTGRIKSLQVIGKPKSEDFKVIIVDDLCSRGGTFLQSAEQLKAMGATEIYLIVTHCENAIFEGGIPTTDLITKVFTTKTMIEESLHPKVEFLLNEAGE